MLQPYNCLGDLCFMRDQSRINQRQISKYGDSNDFPGFSMKMEI